jgi:hypothetical protein
MRVETEGLEMRTVIGAIRPRLLAAIVLAGGLMTTPQQRPAAAQNAAVSAPVASGLDVKTVHYATGMFRMEGARQWVEEGKDGGENYFTEEKRDRSSVVLFDPGRDMRVRLDLKQRQILFAQGRSQFSLLYPIESASAAAAAARTAEQKCVDAVQGKVAWDREGDKAWKPDNLRQLCAGTTLVASAIECFGQEIRSHGDWQRAINSCTEGRHEVQVVYVIPKGQQAKPDAAKALAAIMAVIQRHYFQQLGVTFKLREPLVNVVAIDEGVEELKAKEGEAMFERANRLAKTVFKRGYEYKENLIVTIFEGVDGGVGVGGGNVVAIPSGFWQPAYEMFKRAPADLPKVALLHGWSHEFGHAFGLAHTEDARKCFTNYGVDLGQLPSLIMQKKEDRPTVYDYPFIPQEKRLLLDESYYPACRPTLGDRPHASWHLRHPLPPSSASVVPPVVAAPAPPNAANPAAVVNGLNVTTVLHANGAFRVKGLRLWVEEDRNGVTKFSFGEEKRDESSVVLFDPARNLRVRLDLKQKRVLLSAGTPQFSPLYPIASASAADTAVRTTE